MLPSNVECIASFVMATSIEWVLLLRNSWKRKECRPIRLHKGRHFRRHIWVDLTNIRLLKDADKHLLTNSLIYMKSLSFNTLPWWMFVINGMKQLRYLIPVRNKSPDITPPKDLAVVFLNEHTKSFSCAQSYIHMNGLIVKSSDLHGQPSKLDLYLDKFSQQKSCIEIQQP